MKNAKRMTSLMVGCVVLLGAPLLRAQDWPQWRGPNRDAKATGFKAPKSWPKELTRKWKITVGTGVATPALVGDKLYVFTREDDNEVVRCMEAASGKEVWKEKYAATAPRRPGSGFNNEFIGPRASPAVADGKVVTLGASGILSCFNAATGKQVWRKTDLGRVPRFATSSSPIIVEGLCITQFGHEDGGGIAAFDLASGNQKWKWTGDGTAYSSPVLLTLGGTKVLIAEGSSKIVALGATDGKLLWETDYEVQGRGGYNASTPMVDGQTLIYAGSARGTRAVKLDKKDGKLSATELWKNDNSVQFNTPVLDGDLLFGITESDRLFCINARDGKTAWTANLGGAAAPAKGKGKGRMGAPRGYGSIVAAGPVLIALTPRGQLTVFEPSAREFKQVASYKVAEGNTFAYPVVSGNRIYVQDKDSLTLWTIE